MGHSIMTKADRDRLENLCSEEPTKTCPVCGWPVHAAWVDIGFGAYSQQAGPFHCDTCDWVEECPNVDPARCHGCLNADVCFRPKETP